MIKLETLIDMTDELTEQIVLDKNPDADIFKEEGDGNLRMKKKYAAIRGRIFAILDNNLTGGKYGVQEPKTAKTRVAKVATAVA